jgi:hypothetical protein
VQGGVETGCSSWATTVSPQGLNHRLAKRLLEAHLQWVDEVEAELG